MLRVFLYTLGCRLNQAESAVLQSLLREKGFRVVDSLKESDIVVINSCTVTDQADSDTRKMVNRICRENRAARVAIIGCQAQIQREQLLLLPGVNWVIGTAEKMKLADILNERITAGHILKVPPIRSEPFTIPLTKFAGKRTRANLKIQDGCDNFCAYCEIPFARGRTRSRIFSDIIKEAEALVQSGHREIVLTGINVGLYEYEAQTLIDVVEKLQRIDGIDRIRISSIENNRIPLELTKFMSPYGKVCRSLHIPLQSGSDSILELMGRSYSTADYAKLIKDLSNRVPGIMLGSDIIVGFPGEKENDFQITVSFLEETALNYLHIFPYSDRFKARSRNFKDKVPVSEIRRRSTILHHLSLKKRRDFLSQHIGTVGKVLFEQKKDNYWIGHTDNYVKIKVNSEENLRNQIIDVKMRKLEGQMIIGSLDQ